MRFIFMFLRSFSIYFTQQNYDHQLSKLIQQKSKSIFNKIIEVLWKYFRYLDYYTKQNLQKKNIIMLIESLSDIQLQCQNQSLRPVGKILPPNQIITKDYEPDTKPSIKLLKRQSNTAKFHNKTLKQNQHFYEVDFDQEDTLGYQYSQKIKNNLIFVKFDNRKYLRCPTNNIKYLAGLFIPLPDLLQNEIRQCKSVYKNLESLNSIQYKFNPENSFSTNCLSRDPEVKFSSNYQSANLFMAIKTGTTQYQLILQNDINSKGTTQWFNFAVHLPQENTYKFNIVNLTKSTSLFEKGMKIPYFSYQAKISENQSWVRGCQNITYTKNNINRQGCQDIYYYTLHFQFTSVYKYDTVVFSYGYPYSSIQMEKFFNKITYKRENSLFKIQKIKICETLSGSPIYAYQLSQKKNPTLKSITSTKLFTNQQINIKQSQNSQKGLVFLARQHPGQSQSSFIMEGIINFLLQHNDYQLTKKGFTYYFIPMINADGVYYGNYRTNLSGNDLNRIWKNPRKDFHSEVYFIKKFLINANRSTPIKLILDIHGHSSSLNSFFYGNPIKKQNVKDNDNPKLFPYFCSKRISQISFIQSTFKISEDKKNSARVVLNQLFPKAHVYTFQNSFYGWKKGKKIVEHTIESYKKLGKQLMQSYLQFNRISERNCLIKEKWSKQIEQFIVKKKTKIQEACSDSDSDVSDNLIDYQQELNNIDEIDFNTKSNQTDDKGKIFKQRISSNVRIYSKSRTKKIRYHQPSLSPKGEHQGVFKQSKNTKDYCHPQGFLSIVKIETKKTLDASQAGKQWSLSFKNKQKKNQQNENTDHIQEKQNLQQRLSKISRRSGPSESPKNGNETFRGQKPQFKVRFLNEKQYLMRQRRQKQIKNMSQVWENSAYNNVGIHVSRDSHQMKQEKKQ